MAGVSLQEYMIYWIGLIVITIVVVVSVIVGLVKTFITSRIKRRRD